MMTDNFVMPGEHITEAEELGKTDIVILGPGLRKNEDQVIATKAGILRKKKPNSFWVDSYQKRYIPIRGEAVIGVVTAKAGDVFRVDIGGYELAGLSYLAFEGATKKHRPDVSLGDAIYAKLLVADRNLEPELVCVDSLGKKGKLGVLSAGFVFNCSLNLVRRILNPKCQLIDHLKRQVPFEIAVGMNGRIWIKAKNIKETLLVGNTILATETVLNDDIPNLCINIGNIVFV